MYEFSTHQSSRTNFCSLQKSFKRCPSGAWGSRSRSGASSSRVMGESPLFTSEVVESAPTATCEPMTLSQFSFLHLPWVAGLQSRDL